MSKFDCTICPNCGNEDTSQYEDWIYDYGYTVRICDDDNGCNSLYKVYWETKATRSEFYLKNV